MKISFVVPAHNEEDLIGLCLESILEEIKISGVNSEIIVINNASTDNTRAKAGSYFGVKVIDEPRKGLSQARQTGYELAVGELIANIDADNILPSGWIKKILVEFTNNKNLVALSGPTFFYNLSSWNNFLVKIYYRIAHTFYLLEKFLFKKSNMLQGGNFVLRKSALDKIGGYNVDYKFWGEDIDLARRIKNVGDTKYSFSLQVKSNGRRLIKNGIVSSGWRYFLNYLWVVCFHKPFTRDNSGVIVRGK